MQSIWALGAADMGTWSLITGASLTVQLVMGLLAVLSIVGWYIIVYKYFSTKRAAQQTEQFVDSFWRSRDIEQIYKTAQTLRQSPVSAMFLAGYSELARLAQDGARGAGTSGSSDREADLLSVQRALRRAQTTESTRLEAMIPFLATTGSSAPFIGLFGTVWGIMNSFREISKMKSASIDVVAPHIAEALIATAIGLVAAIPAVMAYNYFVRRIKVQISAMETFEQDYLNIVRRHFLK